MISFDQARKALQRANIPASDRQIAAFLADVLPNPQSGFSCDGATVWGDNHSIDKVKGWNREASTVPAFRATIKHEREGHATSTRQWRSQVDGLQNRAIRAEELGIKMLAFIAQLANSNPAHNASAALAHQFLEDRGITPHDGFFHTQDAAVADARTKFYDAAHPRI